MYSRPSITVRRLRYFAGGYVTVHYWVEWVIKGTYTIFYENLVKMWKIQTGKVTHQNYQKDMENKEERMIWVKKVGKGGNTGSQVGLPTGYIFTLTLYNWHTDGCFYQLVYLLICDITLKITEEGWSNSGKWRKWWNQENSGAHGKMAEISRWWDLQKYFLID